MCIHVCPLHLQNGEILKEDIVLNIFDDEVPELAEYLTLRLVNSYGEAVLSDTAVSHRGMFSSGGGGREV